MFGVPGLGVYSILIQKQDEDEKQCRQRKRILIVDDDLDITFTFKMILEENAVYFFYQVFIFNWLSNK
jgi:hypothetical protein